RIFYSSSKLPYFLCNPSIIVWSRRLITDGPATRTMSPRQDLDADDEHPTLVALPNEENGYVDGRPHFDDEHERRAIELIDAGIDDVPIVLDVLQVHLKDAAIK